MTMGLWRRKQCLAFLIFNTFFITIIFISSYHTTARFRRFNQQNLSSVSKNGNITTLRNQMISSSSIVHEVNKKPGEFVILYWTQYFGDDFKYVWKKLQKEMNSYNPNCFTNCRMEFDHQHLGQSDAVVFHSRDLPKHSLPSTHSEGQVWVYVQQESPAYTREDLHSFQNVFNWTMTYRRDSDIFHPYNRIIPVEHPDANPSKADEYYKTVLAQKTKLVAWVVSNCQTKGKREEYVDELEKFISVDIFGNCGELTCSRRGNGCFSDVIAPQYKFYLSFENSLCVDYITEKFYNALTYNLVPVVYGGGDYDTLAPPKSFINVRNYPSPKALADYLIYLDKHPQEYLKYFEWKSKYKVGQGEGWCSLCRKLSEHKVTPVSKVYPDIERWWNSEPNYDKVTEEDDGGDQNEEIDYHSPLPACEDVSKVADKTSVGVFNSLSHFFQKGLYRWLKRDVFG